MSVGITGERLFEAEGKEPHKKFSAGLFVFLSGADFAELLRRNGFVPGDFGAHSYRKGAITYICTSVVCGPSVFSIFKRVDWHFGVPDTYIFLSEGGDQHVGRAVCGLPGSKVEFASLPPYFREVSVEVDHEIVAFMKSCFPGIPNTSIEFGLRLLAAALFHREFLKRTLSPRHAVKTTSPLFTSPEHVVERFASFVTTEESPTVFATGISPLTVVLQGSEKLQNKMELVEHTLGSFGHKMDNLMHAVAQLQVQQPVQLAQDNVGVRLYIFCLTFCECFSCKDSRNHSRGYRTQLCTPTSVRSFGF
jgi:hypothetical protein